MTMKLFFLNQSLVYLYILEEFNSQFKLKKIPKEDKYSDILIINSRY